MKTLIMYTTKFGYTKLCAKEVHSKLEGSDLKVIDYEKNLDDYDMVLIGSYVLQGKLEDETVEYVKRKRKILRNKKFGMFISGMNTEEFNQAVQDSIPAELFYHAEIVHCGGKIVMERLSRKEKRILKKRIGIKQDTYLNHQDKLDEFVKWALDETT